MHSWQAQMHLRNRHTQETVILYALHVAQIHQQSASSINQVLLKPIYCNCNWGTCIAPY